MPRRPRIKLTGVPLHIMQRGINREPCFFAEEDYHCYLHWLQKSAADWNCAVHAYVLMTNHVHLLITAERRAAELAGALERRGAITKHAPSLSMLPHADDEALLECTRSVLAQPPDTVVATTGIGFRAWIEAADAAGLASSAERRVGKGRAVECRPRWSPSHDTQDCGGRTQCEGRAA